MVKKTSTGYVRVEDLRDDINEIEQKMENIGNDNIISHSTIADIEEEINNIDNKIKDTKRENHRKIRIKNLKIFGRLFQGVFPYVVAAGLIFFLQVIIYDVPFVRQDQFRMAKHEQVIDQTGLVSDNITRVLDKEYPMISYATKWEKKDDGKYYRTLKEYNAGKKSTEDFLNMMKDPNVDFGKILDEHSTKYEVKNAKDITEADLKEGETFKIVYRYTDNEDIVLVMQDAWPNILYTGLYLLFSFFASMPVIFWRVEESDYDFKKYLKEIQSSNPTVDISEFIKAFEEKKVKFEVVKHQQVTLTDPIDNKKSFIKIKK